MSNGNDPHHGFGDILGSTTGIFDGTQGLRDAHGEHHRARAVARPEGIVINFDCQSCGVPKAVIANWPEVVALTYGVQPHLAYQGFQLPPGMSISEWRYDQAQQAWTPPSRCGCGDWLLPAMTINEAAAHLSTAERNGWLGKEDAARLKHVAMAARQRMGG
jgi:hypothetical protein